MALTNSISYNTNIVVKEDTMTETRIIEVTIEIINQEGFANLS